MTDVPRVTSAQRRFSVDDLAALAPDELRKLCHVLLSATEGRVVEARRLADYDEWRLELLPLWRQRTARVRLFRRVVTQDDVERVVSIAADESDFEVLVLAPHGCEAGVGSPLVHLLQPEQMISRLERSALVSWPERVPTPALERLALEHELTASPALYDRLGIRWLPWLAHNELPPDVGVGAPQDLFEVISFRVMTMTFRMGGRRYGTAFRGRRLPDAALSWPPGSEGERVALFDSKASGDGYVMSSDHLLRFKGYPDRVRAVEGKPDLKIDMLIVLSSDFPGTPGQRHPFVGRRDELAADGVQLLYLRAADLARAAVLVEALELSPARREAIDWNALVAMGQPTYADLESAIQGVS